MSFWTFELQKRKVRRKEKEKKETPEIDMDFQNGPMAPRLRTFASGSHWTFQSAKVTGKEREISGEEIG